MTMDFDIYSKPQIQTQWKQRERKLERDWGPSLTVEDETMDLRTIVSKYVNGVPMSGAKDHPFFDEENETAGINPKTLDYAEIQTLKEEAQKAIDRNRSALLKQQETTLAKQKEIEDEKAYQLRKQAEKDAEKSTNIT